MPRHKKIPYRLYGNTVSAFKQEEKAAEGNSGEVPLPGVPLLCLRAGRPQFEQFGAHRAGGHSVPLVRAGRVFPACIGKGQEQHGKNQAKTDAFLSVFVMCQCKNLPSNFCKSMVSMVTASPKYCCRTAFWKSKQMI